MVDYAGKLILVTGGTGFIGGRLAERLAFEHGAEVRVLLRDWRRAVWASRSSATLVEGDVTEPDSLIRALAGCQVVFHCVGVGGSAEVCRHVNVEGTLNVLQAAKAAGVGRVVYLSSVAVHGPNPPENADESAPLVCTGNAYGESKVAAELAIRAFTRESHSPTVVILRPTFVWGPRSEWFTVQPIRQMLAGTWWLVDQGRGTCHAVYIDNLVDALLLAGELPGVAGEAFLITDDQPGTWADFFLSYARMVGRDFLPSVSSQDLRNHPLVRRLDRELSRIHDFLGDHLPRLEPLRFSFRGARVLIRQVRRSLHATQIWSEWDLAKYARCGRLNTSKAKEQLGYIARISRTEGMRLTESWLRDQRIIPEV
jgi:nucleoside-diphosphate-sugar epimerase